MSQSHPPVLIFTIANRAAVIAGYGFMPIRAFSVYALYEEFLREVAEVQQSDENFINWLIDQHYGIYLAPEETPEQATKFLTWEIRPTALDLGATFDIIHRFPTVMTQHLLEQLATGWRTQIFQVAQFSRNDYFNFLKEKMVDEQSIKELRITVVKSALKMKEDRLIAEHGYTKQFVGSGEGTTQFCYTIGLTPRAGAEVIAFCAVPMELLANVVDLVAGELLTGCLTLGVRDDLLKPSGDVAPLRLKVVHVNATEALDNYILNTRSTVHRVYQVLFPDGNNILPDEEGYDTSFPQHQFPLAPTQA